MLYVYIFLFFLTIILFFIGFLLGKIQKKYMNTLVDDFNQDTSTININLDLSNEIIKNDNLGEPKIISSVLIEESLEMYDDEEEII
jgi:hypothetical protein